MASYETDKMYYAGYLAGVLKIRPSSYGLTPGGSFFAKFPTLTQEEGKAHEMDFVVSPHKSFDDAIQHFKRTCYGDKKRP